MAPPGLPHCVTDVLRLRYRYHQVHWTSPDPFLHEGRCGVTAHSLCLLRVLLFQLGLPAEVVAAIDGTVVDDWGPRFFGLANLVAHYPKKRCFRCHSKCLGWG
jgi:hypothetical protein